MNKINRIFKILTISVISSLTIKSERYIKHVINKVNDQMSIMLPAEQPQEWVIPGSVVKLETIAFRFSNIA